MRRTLLTLSLLFVACGGGTTEADTGVPFDSASTSDAAADVAVIGDGGDEPDMQATGGCVLTLSAKSPTCNATATTLEFPFMFAPGTGLGCNEAAAPTSCGVGATQSGTVTWSSAQDFESSLGAGTTIPFISAIAVSPDTAIFVYLEGSMRWHASPGGSFVIDQLSGSDVSLHFTVDLEPDTSPSGAAGTFTIDGVCTAINFQP